MKRIFVIVLFTVFFISAHSQNPQLKYEYDNAGNRISRVIVFDKKSQTNNADTSNVVDVPLITEWLDKNKIEVYPNPTSGVLRVEINNITEPVSGKMAIYSIEGKMLDHYETIHKSTRIDFSQYSDGIYLFRISFNGKSCEWKIIKQ